MKEKKKSALLISGIKLVIGCLVEAVGFQYFLYPNSIICGGVTGISMIINYLFKTPVGIMIIILNIPLFVIGFKQFGRKFVAGSLAGMLLSSVFVDILAMHPVVITTEPILGAVYGGVFMGFGFGLVYSTGATCGGTDIAAKVIKKYSPHTNFSSLLLMLDAVIISAFALIFGEYERALYAVICSFIVSKAIDFVLYGAINSKLCYIISEDVGEIKAAINSRLVRGATILSAQGAYTGGAKQIVLCVINRRQIIGLRRIVKEFDQNAFIVVCDAREVFGLGFSSMDE